jgi:hypothetical protein
VSKVARVGILLGLPVFVAFISGVMYPGRRVVIALVMVGIGLVSLLVALLWWIAWSARGSGPVTKLLRPYRARPSRPSDLAGFERTFGWKIYSEPEFNHRLRPVLRSIVRSRLRHSHAVDVDNSPQVALARVPAGLQTLIPDPPPAPDESVRIRTDDLMQIVSELEAL